MSNTIAEDQLAELKVDFDKLEFQYKELQKILRKTIHLIKT